MFYYGKTEWRIKRIFFSLNLHSEQSFWASIYEILTLQIRIFFTENIYQLAIIIHKSEKQNLL